MFWKTAPKPVAIDNLFVVQACILVESAGLLERIVTEQGVSDHMLDTVKQKEHTADTVAQNIFGALEDIRNMLVYDRTEGYKLARGIEDMIDAIGTVVKKMHIYGVKPERTPCIEFARVVTLAANEIDAGIHDMVNRVEKNEQIIKHCAELHHLEGVCDEIYTRNLKKLMQSTDVYEIVQMKDVYGDLERCMDIAQNVGDALASVCMMRK